MLYLIMRATRSQVLPKVLRSFFPRSWPPPVLLNHAIERLLIQTSFSSTSNSALIREWHEHRTGELHLTANPKDCCVLMSRYISRRDARLVRCGP